MSAQSRGRHAGIFDRGEARQLPLLEFSFAFSVNLKVLACMRRYDAPNGQTARKPDGATQPGVRHLTQLANLRSALG